ncbi:MAG: DEAD/DEAH box helicase family protein [Candidatus Latescibacteria bacterium]|jgi:superfamily II DNA or RNA helicase|nr:helicase [Gemmatimonadaceae bacterium]MDP7448658.1 DEAD/DEAH box helicase family protein [Candidatus Latescibacterota bacterium]HJP34225.1 DEAD/DEAH box helicase family protein [Candidatus Latescibacterota bacterium]
MDLCFEEGTLVLRGCPRRVVSPHGFSWDERRDVYRTPACRYREVVTLLGADGSQWRDQAQGYERITWSPTGTIEPRSYQSAAIDAWDAAGQRGVVVLPTGSGKSQVGIMAICRSGRSSLVIAPTIDLMNQWYELLCEHFGEARVGLMGGGTHDLRQVTAATYHSAYLHVEHWGHRYGFVLFDEVHHLPGPRFRHAAEMCLAPFRLGLTATLERPDGGHDLLDGLVGPVVFRQEIGNLAGTWLAPYRLERREVAMVAEERSAYRVAEGEYRSFLRDKGVSLASPGGWNTFVRLSGASGQGRRAMRAYREHRRIALGASGKRQVLERILKDHDSDRVLIFTQDNDTVYDISRDLLIPAITHQTPTRERRQLLLGFNAGEHLALITSKVLNEGVNIPAASVAVVLSGSSTTREHVQRLGRILRPVNGKQAVLYEVVTKGTVEREISRRRRQHSAYDDGPEDGE